jgi:hypothetical protein
LSKYSFERQTKEEKIVSQETLTEVSQESFTKKHLSGIKIRNIEIMKTEKSTAVFLIGLTIMPALIPLVTANFMPAYSHISILSPGDASSRLKYKYENSTVNLTISVTLVKEGLTEPPKVHFISYSLDGQPLVYLRNLTATTSHYSIYNQDITRYSATTILENLSEGNHTIGAYANDMSSSSAFTVDSHYVVPVIKILSPTSQTYSSDVPVVFTVNQNFSNAHYLMWDWKKMDSHFGGQLNGNSTLKNLSGGDYIIHVSATTDKGDYIVATASFNVSWLNPTTLFAITSIIVVLAVALFSFVYFKRRRKT